MSPSQADPSQRSVRDLDKALDKQSFEQKRNWLRATAISSAAVSMVGSVASEGVAISSQPNAEAVLPIAAQPAGYAIANAQSINKSAPVLPAIEQSSAAAFSQAQTSTDRTSTARTSTVRTSTAQTSLITQAQDGSWTLSTDIPTSTNAQRLNARASQAVIADLAQQTEQTRQACRGRECQSLAYIDSKLPEAREDVAKLQAELDDFEAHHAQQDMEGYQELLTDRIFEIAKQKQDLVSATERNQRRITQIKTALVQMDADLEMAERALEADATYQAAWNQLIQAEQNLMNEFSQVKLDATELNEIYSDYQYQQQQTRTAASEALGNYLMQAPTTPSFIARSPDALNRLQELTVTTHEYRTQKLRQTTISQIQKRLNNRESELIGDISGYEKLELELTAAKAIVKEYEKERSRILARQPVPDSAAQNNVQQTAQQLEARSATALDRARRLAPRLPEGSVAQGVIYAVLAAGAIAAIAARKRNSKANVPQIAIQHSRTHDYSFQPTPLQQANLMAAIKLPALRLSAAQLQTESTSLQPVLPQSDRPSSTLPSELSKADEHLSEEPLLLAAPAARLHGEQSNEGPSLEEILAEAAPARPEPDDFEQRILAELMEITGQSARMLPAAKEPAALEENNSLTIETMVRDLQEVIGTTTPEGSLVQEIQSREIEPVQLSLEDVDLFAEHALQWILKDLGISPMAATLDKAEAEARGWSPEEAAEIEAISIESLEVVQSPDLAARQAPYPGTEIPSAKKLPAEKLPAKKLPAEKLPAKEASADKVSKEFATVAA